MIEIAGTESEGELAYAGLHQLCLPFVGRVDALAEPQREGLQVAFGIADGKVPGRVVVGLATLSLLADVAGERPLVCIVDDAQWLDEASKEVLGFVARRLAAESLALVFGVRDSEESAKDGPFGNLPLLRLGGLSYEDGRALLATVVPGRLDPAIGKRIVAETGGNPLALVELPRGMNPAELAAGFGLPVGAAVAAGLESHYAGRVGRLPEPTQQFMLLAASDGVGHASIVWRAADVLGIARDAAEPAVAEGLFEAGAQMQFRHPLVRSAVYNAASPENRRRAHEALAWAIDPEAEPDRRAWHRANACSGPDDEVASELARSAGRAQARGGYAAAAALLERSASLTTVSTTRVARRLEAVRCHFRAGAFETALRLLAVAESETSDESDHARIGLLYAQVASSFDAGGDAPYRLVQAAKRLEPFDAELASRTYSDAWVASMFAGHLASQGGSLLEVSQAARVSDRSNGPRPPFDKLSSAMFELVTRGRGEAEPTLRSALEDVRTSDLPTEIWLHDAVMGVVAAAAVWDMDAWEDIATRQVELARDLGALAGLPTALSGLAMVATWRGEFDRAAALTTQAAAVADATGSRLAPYGAMLLAAYRGRADEATALIDLTTDDSYRRGEGLGVDLARWASAVLHNGLRQYPQAMAAAVPADATSPGLLFSTWMLPERIEAAVRCRKEDVAAAAMSTFDSTSNAQGSDWGLGIGARSLAMLKTGDEADHLYNLAIHRLTKVGVRVELARAHLVYGEWLRRENRRSEARTQLRTAYDMFVAMSADGFAERARHELLATGEHVRPRDTDRWAELTPQEEHIARLARDGRSNPQIAAELFISSRTVEWHLRKVFAKLQISSRRELADGLSGPGSAT